MLHAVYRLAMKVATPHHYRRIRAPPLIAQRCTFLALHELNLDLSGSLRRGAYS